MESKKNTFQIVLIGILTVLVLILAAALYRSWRVEGELRAQLAEAQNNAMTVENEQGTQLAAAADNALTVRVMNGILQQQDASGQWLDVAPVEELRQADSKVSISRALSQGLTMKSVAPSLMPRTARSMSA